MVADNTPPASPRDSIQEAQDEAEDMELFEDDLVEVNIDDILEGEEAAEDGAHDDEEEDDDDIIEGVNSFDPVQDDSSYVFTKHTGSVFCCHLDPGSGTLAVTGGQDDAAYVWNIETGEVVLHCTGHRDSVVCCKFSHDGTYVATGDMSGVVQVWRLTTKERIWETTIGDLAWLKWHHGANVLIGGTVSGEVYMWRIPSGDCRILPGHGEKTDCGVILPDGKRAAVGYDNGCVAVFDLKAGAVLHRLEPGPDTGLITSLDAHADNNLLIAGTTGGKAMVIKTQTGKMVASLDCDGPASRESSRQCVEATGFCRSTGLAIAATGTLDGYLTLWDTGRLVERNVSKQPSGITQLAWDPFEPLLYTAGLDGVVRLFDGRGGELLRQWSGCRGEILDLSMSGCGKIVLVGSDDTTARVFRRTIV